MSPLDSGDGHFGGHIGFEDSIDIYMTFDCFNGSAMIKNICKDANIFTQGVFLSEIEPFY